MSIWMKIMKDLLVLVVINLPHDNFCLGGGVGSATSAYAEVRVYKLPICREARWTFPKCRPFLPRGLTMGGFNCLHLVFMKWLILVLVALIVVRLILHIELGTPLCAEFWKWAITFAPNYRQNKASLLLFHIYFMDCRLIS